MLVVNSLGPGTDGFCHLKGRVCWLFVRLETELLTWAEVQKANALPTALSGAGDGLAGSLNA